MINKYLYPKGGDAISTVTTGKLLASKGHEVSFWGMMTPSNPPYKNDDLFVDFVDYYKPASLKEKIRISLNILYSAEAKHKLERLINIERPDLVHMNNIAHQISPSILHILNKYNIPSVLTMRDFKAVCPVYTLYSKGKCCEKCKYGDYFQCVLNKCAKDSFSKSFLNMLEMYLHHKILNIYDLVDAYISPSVFLKNKCREMGFKNHIFYLPNFIMPDEYVPSYEWSDNSIVYVGRLSSEKGLFCLIDAVRDIDVKLKIIGDGPYKQALTDKVRRDGVNNVTFLGYKTGGDLKQEIQKCKFTVIPSEWYENNPRTIIESFASGKPSIGSTSGGIPELIKDGIRGYTFEPGNVRDLKSKIEILLSRPDSIIEMGKTARKYIEDNLNPEIHYSELMKIYDSAIIKHRNTANTRMSSH